ncbi:unnamed protein product [Dicrocoelium dendriticum]|nr:unnamed protein product [Dicrocoelium dendriticum]
MASCGVQNRRMLKRLMRVGKQKIAHLERHSPGKLLDRHLLLKALSTWRAMRDRSLPQNSWCIVDPPTSDSFSWDEDCSFDSVSSLSEYHLLTPLILA